MLICLAVQRKIIGNLSTRRSWYHERQPEVFLQLESHWACQEVFEPRSRTSKREFSGWNQRFKFWVLWRVFVILKWKFFVRKKQNLTQIFERHFYVNYSVGVRHVFTLFLLNDLHLARKPGPWSSSARSAMPYVNQERLVLKFPNDDTVDFYDVFASHNRLESVNDVVYKSVKIFFTWFFCVYRECVSVKLFIVRKIY